MAGYRVFDIETVVDGRFWTPPPTDWVQKPIDKGHGEDLQENAPTLWWPKEIFPPPQAHRVVAVSWVDLSGDDDKWYSYEGSTSLCKWKHGDLADEVERELLVAFGEAQQKDLACLVTWNGRGFDLPVINLRSLLHRLPCPWYYVERDVRYRYSEAGHCDLMDVFSDYGASRQMKLGDVAKIVGLPGKVGEVSGSSVAEVYDQGDVASNMKKVGAYCLLDSLQTAILFARSREHKGMIDRAYYDRVVGPSFEAPLAAALKEVVG